MLVLVNWKMEEGTEIQHVLDGVTLPLKTQVPSLDVLLDSSLNFRTHAQVSGMARSAFAQLKLVYHLHPIP